MKKYNIFKILTFKKMIFLISLFLISIFNVNSQGYNYASYTWESFHSKYKDYWTASCASDEPGCEEHVLASQKKFYNRLYKFLTKYERQGIYVSDDIIVATIYFGMGPSTFNDDSEVIRNMYGEAAYNSDGTDDFNESDEEYVQMATDPRKADTIKLLLGAMVGYEAVCFKYDEPYTVEVDDPYNEGQKITEYRCDQGAVDFSSGSPRCKYSISSEQVNLAERAISNSKVLSFFGIKSERKKDCENQGGEYVVSTKKTVNVTNYWKFLKESTFFDSRPMYEDNFASVVTDSGYSSLNALNVAMDNDQEVFNKYQPELVNVREQIVEKIQEALEMFHEEYPENVNLYGANVLQNIFYWPIGSEEVTEENGVKFAKGDPIDAQISRNYNPGNGNNGIDILASISDANIISVKAGVVSKVVKDCVVGDKECNDGFGNYISITHSDATIAVYSFLGDIYVDTGDSVQIGQLIAKIGNTGDTPGSTLHFEIKENGGSQVDPTKYISEDNPRPVPNSFGTIEGGNDQQTVCLTLRGMGASDAGVAGAMANIYAESSLYSKNLQNDYESIVGYNDISYTEAVDNGTYHNFVHDSAGYGLCQWTYHSRKAGLLASAQSKGTSIGDVGMQLSFMFEELSAGYPSLSNAIMSGSSSVDEIARVFCDSFENPLHHDQCSTTRVDYAHQFYTYVSNGCN